MRLLVIQNYFCKLKTAVIDIGTNTFNLLIVEKKGKHPNTLHNSRIPVRLGKGGITKKKITEDAFQRGIEALKELKKIIDDYSCNGIYAFATSMVRDADNGLVFVEEVKKQTGITVHIISGDREAELICNGVRKAVKMDRKMLIMDIGGGSTEFIIADRNNIYWKKSYQLGVTRLYETFQQNDPITLAEIHQTETLLEKELNELILELNREKIESLIGSAGSFESYAEMIECKISGKGIDPKTPSQHLHLQEMKLLLEEIIISNHEERKRMKGLHEIRRDLIVMASILIRFILKKAAFNEVIYSAYALKEGVLLEDENSIDAF